MDERGFPIHSEQELEQLLQEELSQLPPPEVVIRDTTPWRRAMNRALLGMGLTTVTLNFLGLNYLLPAIGAVLMWLGFRTLRRENPWFRACWVISILRVVNLWVNLCLNATIWQAGWQGSPANTVQTVAVPLLCLVQILCLRAGLRAVQQKAGQPVSTPGATALVVWYQVMCGLALVEYSGLLLGLGMIVTYFFLLRSLLRLSKALDEAGYAVQAAPVRVPDRALAGVLTGILVVGIALGYLFGGRYDMDWTPVDPAEQVGLEELRADLLDLGFPEDVLNDLSAEDLAACEGALQVVSASHSWPVNDGRWEQTRGSGALVHSVVYDVEELLITGVAVELPGPRETWKIFHHFRWTEDPGYRGTDAIQIWTADRIDAWSRGAELTGRLLCELDGESRTAEYVCLGVETYQSNSFFFGLSESSDVFAAFSFPDTGRQCRGYVAYDALENADGSIIDSWINYVYQRSWLQYPVQTALTYRQSGGTYSHRQAFKLIQDALQFYPGDENPTPF